MYPHFARAHGVTYGILYSKHFLMKKAKNLPAIRSLLSTSYPKLAPEKNVAVAPQAKISFWPILKNRDSDPKNEFLTFRESTDPT